MKGYIKVKKSYVLIFFIVFVFISCTGGYYLWCSQHPEINILISDGSTGIADIKIEAPSIGIAGKGIAEPAASVELKVNNLIMQHEYFCDYVKNTYKAADIKLDIAIENKQTVLKYYGTAVDLNDETVNFKKEITCDYVLDATIEHK